MEERVEELRRELEELIFKLINTSVDTVEAFINLFTETLRRFAKYSPIPLIIPQVVIPESLKRKPAQDIAKVLSTLIVAPLSPEQVRRLIDEVVLFAERIKEKMKEKGSRA